MVGIVFPFSVYFMGGDANLDGVSRSKSDLLFDDFVFCRTGVRWCFRNHL